MAQSLFEALAALTPNLPSVKAAAEVGKTTHPVAKLDDGSKPVSTGAFAAEQSAGVKKQQNQLLESAGEQTYDADAAAQNTNLKATQTGKDPSTERDFTTKETDPGTTHPARVDKSANLAKYASASIVELYGASSDLANAILADFGNNQLVSKQAAVVPQPTAAAPAVRSVAQKIAAAANGMPVGGLENDPFAAGYLAAAHAGVSKSAADQAVAEYLQKVAADATLDAELCINYFNKAASEMPPAEPKEESPASPGASNMAESGGSSASEGGESKKDEAAEGKPDAAAGLAGSGAESGMSQDEAMAALDEVLQELGVSPEELVEALQAQAAGGAGGPEGGMPPEAGGMPPEGGMPPDMGAGGMPPDMGAGGMPPDAGMPPGMMPPEGGMPPDAGGMPPPPPGGGMSPEQGMKLASDIWARRKNMANLQKMASAAGIPISVQKASASSKVVMRSYLSELLGR